MGPDELQELALARKGQEIQQQQGDHVAVAEDGLGVGFTLQQGPTMVAISSFLGPI